MTGESGRGKGVWEGGGAGKRGHGGSGVTRGGLGG